MHNAAVCGSRRLVSGEAEEEAHEEAHRTSLHEYYTRRFADGGACAVHFPGPSMFNNSLVSFESARYHVLVFCRIPFAYQRPPKATDRIDRYLLNEMSRQR